MSRAVILAVDCGLAHTGWAVLHADFIVKPLSAGVIRTAPSQAKRRILSTDDTGRRLRELASELNWISEKWRPQIVSCEAVSCPRNASSSGKLHAAWACLATITELRGLPFLQVSPQEVRKRLLGSAGASKELVEVEVRKRLPALSDLLVSVPSGQRNHAYDAAAVGLSVLGSDVVRVLMGAA